MEADCSKRKSTEQFLMENKMQIKKKYRQFQVKKVRERQLKIRNPSYTFPLERKNVRWPIQENNKKILKQPQKRKYMQDIENAGKKLETASFYSIPVEKPQMKVKDKKKRKEDIPEKPYSLRTTGPTEFTQNYPLSVGYTYRKGNQYKNRPVRSENSQRTGYYRKYALRQIKGDYRNVTVKSSSDFQKTNKEYVYGQSGVQKIKHSRKEKKREHNKQPETDSNQSKNAYQRTGREGRKKRRTGEKPEGNITYLKIWKRKFQIKMLRELKLETGTEEKESILPLELLKTGALEIAGVLGKLLLKGLLNLLPVILPAILVVLGIYAAYNTAFSILLPAVEEGTKIEEILQEFHSAFYEKIEAEKENLQNADRAEIIYPDYEGDGTPENFPDVLMTYMVLNGAGNMATVVTAENRHIMQEIFKQMCRYSIVERMEIEEVPVEIVDEEGNVTIEMEIREVTIKEIRIHLLFYTDVLEKGWVEGDDAEILRFLMSPEILALLPDIPKGNIGEWGETNLPDGTDLGLGDDSASRAVQAAVNKLGTPYSQAHRDDGDYFDCSSLTYYCYLEAGISLMYQGSNTAANQAKFLEDRGCSVAYEDIVPGDLIFYSFERNGRYKNISHVAMYVGNGMVIDASSSKGCVVYRRIYSVSDIVACGRPALL